MLGMLPQSSNESVTDSSDDQESRSRHRKRRNAKSRRNHNREDNKKGKDKPAAQVTLSGLLNAVDGTAAPTGHIFIMTTNHKERLGEAMKRRGRADRDVFFGYVTREQTWDLFLEVYDSDPDMEEEARPYDRNILHLLAERFADMIAPETLPPVSTQEYLLTHDEDPQAAIDAVAVWYEEELAYVQEGKDDEQKDVTLDT
ncbi:hypothetical protein LTR64_004481 [Lithohypha guttulata]|uniref:uncharacterized protein n=1 Tax=Lithohypha guttulata TaxID=1690604 RepID=UPI002DE1260A|nr:hypothetical protein LTR51_006223 [Lithohypha guttulata]